MSRKLTSKEIDNLLDFITIDKSLPLDTAVSIYNNNRNRFVKQLENQLVYPVIIPKLKEELRKNYIQSQIQPGESVGIISAQSIGQKNTQSTLNTFHKAGQAETQVLTGVPRFQELLNTTKEPKGPSCKIFFRKKHKTLKSIKNTVKYNIKELKFKDISKECSVLVEKENHEWYEIFNMLYEDREWFRSLNEDYTGFLKIKLNMDILFKYKLPMVEIVKIIHNSFLDSVCFFSTESIGEIHIYFDMSNIELDEELLFVNEENKEEIYLEEVVEPKIKDMTIAGISNISNIYYLKEGSEWILETDGTNYRDIMNISFVDKLRTVSNDIWEIYNILGVEATREYLLEEFQSIMEGINKCHIDILVERMTFGGGISSISRYTMRKEKIGPISKSSFEETVDQFLRAGINNEVDNIKAVSSNIVCGNVADFGTGMMELKVDVDKIINNDELNFI